MAHKCKEKNKMNKTNKATTTTMARRVSAALLAVCIATVHLAMPVKAATAFTTVSAGGQYPNTMPESPSKEYNASIHGTDESLTSDMSYGSVQTLIRMDGAFVARNIYTLSITEFTFNVTGNGSIGYNEAITSQSIAYGWRFHHADSDYYVSAHKVTTLHLQ